MQSMHQVPLGSPDLESAGGGRGAGGSNGGGGRGGGGTSGGYTRVPTTGDGGEGDSQTTSSQHDLLRQQQERLLLDQDRQLGEMSEVRRERVFFNSNLRGFKLLSPIFKLATGRGRTERCISADRR